MTDRDSWTDPDAEDGWTGMTLNEQLIREDERLKVLREVRKAASDMDRNRANDPYLWGYGARNIVGMITKKLAEQRELMGIEIRKDGRHYPA